MEVHPETLRRWSAGAKDVEPDARKGDAPETAEAKEHFGELVQMDGSFHDWFEERGPKAA